MAHRNYRAFAATIAAALVVGAVAGCSDTEQGTAPPPAEKTAEPLSASQIAGVALDLSRSEVTQAQAAMPRAQDSQVRAFAQRMFDDHQATEDKLQAFLETMRIVPDKSELSADVERVGTSMTNNLRQASAHDFDVSYLEVQIYMHRRALTILDRQLIPQATQPDLQGELQAMRAMIADHLNEALQIRDRFPPDLPTRL